jgi:PAP2 superfamily
VTRLEVRRPAPRHTLVRQPAPARRAGLTWPRLPVAAEVAITGAGYLAYALVHLDVEPSLNHLASASPAMAEATGYYYGLLHFIVTPLVLGWLYLRRPPAFPRLR